MRKSWVFWFLGAIGCAAIIWLVWSASSKKPQSALITIDDILVMLKSPDTTQRNVALARVVTGFGDERQAAIPVLIELLNEDNYSHNIPITLVQLGYREPLVIQALCRVLQRNNLQKNSERVCNTLGNIGVRAASNMHLLGLSDALLTQAFTEDGSIRRIHFDNSAVISALGTVGPAAASATSEIIPFLNDPFGPIRIAAAEALAKIGIQTDLAVNALVELLQHRDISMHYAAARSLLLTDYGKPAQKAVAALKAVCQDNWVNNRLTAAEALWRIDPSQHEIVVATLVDVIKKHKDPVYIGEATRVLIEMKTLAKPAIPALQEAIKSTDFEIREAALLALEKISPGSAFDVKDR